MQKLKKYNASNTLLVITSFPNPENGRQGKRALNAVGWHSERLMHQLGKGRKIIVLAEKAEGKSEFNAGKQILVKRVWKKGSLFSFFRMARFIKNQASIKEILVQFEFNVFGGILPNLYLLLLILYLRLLGKRVTFELHQVILDIKQLQKHINITNPLVQRFYNLSLKFYYMLVGLLVNNIIVFEVELKNRLQKYVSADKIYVLSLSVEKKKLIRKSLARKLANKNLVFKRHKIKKDEFVLLVFGFINGYKGIDWVIKQMKGIKNKKLRLLVVGGKNPYLTDKPAYQAFYESIIADLKKYKNMSYVDFVPEKDIPIYYSAADAAVIPYEVFMAASGPFSHALSYGKPILISEHLELYTKSQDIAAAMSETNLSSNEFIFKFTKRDFLKKVAALQENKNTYNKLEDFSAKLAALRSIQKVALRMDRIIFSGFYVSREQKFLSFVKRIPAFK